MDWFWSFLSCINYTVCNCSAAWDSLNKNTNTGNTNRYQLNSATNPLCPVTFYTRYQTASITVNSNGSISSYDWTAITITGGINYKACNTASADGNKCIATDYLEYNQPVSKYSRSTTNNWVSDMNCDSTGLGYKTQSGHYHYPVITYMGSINYTACNIGSILFNIQNGNQVINLEYSKQNSVNSTGNGKYASITAYIPGIGSASLNSSGRATSALGSSWGAYYPAIY